MLSHAFTTREKILLAVVTVFLLAFCYYQFVFVYAQDTITEANTAITLAESQLADEQSKSIKLKQMKSELQTIFDSIDKAVEIPKYDNLPNVVTELKGILSTADECAINFGDPNIEGDVARRSVNMKFNCNNYAHARAIFEQFSACKYRCELQDLSITVKNPAKDANISNGIVHVTVSVLFYEAI